MPEEARAWSGRDLAFLVSIEDDEDLGSGEKSIFGERGTASSALRAIPLAILKENLAQTIDDLRELFDASASSQQADLPLKEVQVSFEVTASGKIAIVGSSAGLAGSGAITLIFGK